MLVEEEFLQPSRRCRNLQHPMRCEERMNLQIRQPKSE